MAEAFAVMKDMEKLMAHTKAIAEKLLDSKRVTRRQYLTLANELYGINNALTTIATALDQQTTHLEENTALRVKAHMWDELAHRIKVGLGALVQKAAQSNYPEDAVRLNAKLSGVKLVQDWMQDMERSMGGGLDS